MVEITGGRPMRAGEVLHNVLAPAGVRLDARLWRRLCGAVEVLVRSRQVVLIELARQYPGATRVAAPLKALDRLLSNRRLQQARGVLYGVALQRLWPRYRAVIVVDWCVRKADESLHLLRAALPVGGRTLPVWDEVHGQAQLGQAAGCTRPFWHGCGGFACGQSADRGDQCRLADAGCRGFAVPRRWGWPASAGCAG